MQKMKEVWVGQVKPVNQTNKLDISYTFNGTFINSIISYSQNKLRNYFEKISPDPGTKTPISNDLAAYIFH